MDEAAITQIVQPASAPPSPPAPPAEPAKSFEERFGASWVVWIGGLALYVTISGVLHAGLGRSRLELSAALVMAPLSVVFLVCTGRMLSAKRLAGPDVLPFAVIGRAPPPPCSLRSSV